MAQGDASSVQFQIEAFRNANDSESMRDALAMLSVLLLDPLQREYFKTCDGTMTLGTRRESEMCYEGNNGA